MDTCEIDINLNLQKVRICKFNSLISVFFGFIIFQIHYHACQQQDFYSQDTSAYIIMIIKKEMKWCQVTGYR